LPSVAAATADSNRADRDDDTARTKASAVAPLEQPAEHAHGLLRSLEHKRDRLRQTFPVCAFDFELRLDGPRQAVEFRLASGFRRFPFGSQQTPLLETVQRGLERALLDSERFFRDLLDALRDRVTVQRPERSDLKNQQIKGSLEQVGLCGTHHLPRHSTYIYGCICRLSRCAGWHLLAGNADVVELEVTRAARHSSYAGNKRPHEIFVRIRATLEA
jgi:hypothetical protein